MTSEGGYDINFIEICRVYVSPIESTAAYQVVYAMKISYPDSFQEFERAMLLPMDFVNSGP